MSVNEARSVRARSRRGLLVLAVSAGLLGGVSSANAASATQAPPAQSLLPAADGRPERPGLAIGSVLPDQASEAVSRTDRVLVGWSAQLAATSAGAVPRLADLASATGRQPAFVRVDASGAAIYDLGAPLGADAGRILEAIGRMPGVMTAEPDLWMTADTLPNDTYSASLWGLLGAADMSDYGVDARGAWGTTTGDGVVVAVIDTGLVAHVDLAGQAIAGYDMISDVAVSNDGDGRDGDASDPGDWSDVGDWCGARASSWHGTHVAGTIAALSNNGIGVFGGAPGVKIQPVRALGSCGGYLSDAADGIRWAAGGNVPGVASNPTPARVLNLSLGGSSPSCPASLSSAISDARSRGAVVVVSAGNAAMDASQFAPANCDGVITVAATDSTGRRASFSNFGATVEMAGPGVSILSTIDTGTTIPTGSWYAYYSGTSMAAPHVALSAALVVAAAPTLTPAEIESVLAATSTAFASDADCASVGCGAGIVHAGRAVASVTQPTTPGPPTTVRATPGDASALVSWTAPASSGGSPITAYTVTSSPGARTCSTGTLSCTVAGLTNGTPYTFSVTATNAAGPGPASAPSGAVTPRTIPGPPTAVSATPGDASALVSWTAPASSGGSPITAYTVTSSPGAKTCATGARSCTVGGLTNGTPYTYRVTATNAAGKGPRSAPSGSVIPIGPLAAGAVYVPLTPVRLLDTRIGNGLAGTFRTGVVRTFVVAGQGDVPADAVAVTGNLTVTGQTSAGYVSVGPTMSSSPTTSSLNAPRGDTRANGLTVRLSTQGKLAAVWTGAPGSTTNLVFDVTGYFTETGAGAVYVPLTPVRLLDTRIGNGLAGTFRTGVVRTFVVAGQGDVPADAVAVTGNLTVTGQTSAGYVSVGPTMSSSPTTSSLNAPRGDTRANGLTVRLSTQGKLAAVWTGAPGSTTNLVFDVTGYFTETGAGAVYVPLTPVRLLDSRIGNGLAGTFRTGVVRTFVVAGQGDVPADAVAVTGNLTVTGQTSAGYVSVGPTMSSSPTTSSLNAPRGDTRANGLTVRLSTQGKLAAVWTGAPGSTTNLVFDVTGYFR